MEAAIRVSRRVDRIGSDPFEDGATVRVQRTMHAMQASTAASRQPLPGGGGLAAAAAHVPSFFYFYFYFFCVEIKFLAPNTYTVFPSGQGGTTGHFFFIAGVDVGAPGPCR